jgi:hypothetical protein
LRSVLHDTSVGQCAGYVSLRRVLENHPAGQLFASLSLSDTEESWANGKSSKTGQGNSQTRERMSGRPFAPLVLDLNYKNRARGASGSEGTSSSPVRASPLRPNTAPSPLSTNPVVSAKRIKAGYDYLSALQESSEFSIRPPMSAAPPSPMNGAGGRSAPSSPVRCAGLVACLPPESRRCPGLPLTSLYRASPIVRSGPSSQDSGQQQTDGFDARDRPPGSSD